MRSFATNTVPGDAVERRAPRPARDGIHKAWRDDALPGALLIRARYAAHRFAPHLHDEMVIVVNEAGTSEVQAPFGSGLSRPGTVWVFAPGEVHSGHVPEGANWAYRAIYLDAEAMAGIADMMEVAPGALPRIPPGLYEDAALAMALRDAHACLEMCGSPAQREATWAYAMARLFQAEPGMDVTPCRPPTGQSMARALEFVQAHCRDDFSIADLAQATGLSRYHLMRSFQRAFGLPPRAYANQLRLASARRLLTAGQRPAEVALELGFYDQSHMTRLFTRAFGLSPARYAALPAGSA